MTIPTGTGIHRRMVYIELEEGYKAEEVAAAIKSDDYFAHDETHVNVVDSVDALIDMGHGVNMTRKGVSGKTQELLNANKQVAILCRKSLLLTYCLEIEHNGLLSSAKGVIQENQ